MTPMKRALHRASLTLSFMGIKHWLDCGTCLGAVRHKDFIPWDKDIDLGIAYRETGAHDEKEAIKKAFLLADFDLYREWKHGEHTTELSFRLDSIKVDLFFYWEKNGKAYQGSFAPDDFGLYERFILHEFTASLFWELDVIEFKGLCCNVPSPVGQYLTERYGEWLIPDNKYVYWKDCKAIVKGGFKNGN